MLYSVGIKDGFAQLKGNGKHVKIISALTQVRMQAVDDKGRILVDTKFRAPMATELPAAASTLNFYAEDQAIEVWFSNQPLEFFQLTAVGARSIRSGQVGAKVGKTKILDANQRLSVSLLPSEDVIIGGADVNAGGWPVKAGEMQNFTTSGAVYAFRPLNSFDYANVSGAASALFSVTSTGAIWKQSAIGAYFFDYWSNTTRRIDRATGEFVTVAELPSCIGMIRRGNSLFAILRSSDKTKILKTEDGLSWGNVAETDRILDRIVGASSDAVHNRSAGDWLTVKQLSPQEFVAINIRTGETKSVLFESTQKAWATYLPDQNVFLISVYGNAAESGVYKAAPSGEAVKIYNNPSAVLFELLTNEDEESFIFEAGAIKSLDINGVAETKLSITTSPREYYYVENSKYLFARRDSGTTVQIYVLGDGITAANKQITNMPDLCELIYDIDNSAIVGHKTTIFGNYASNQLAINSLPVYEPVSINFLEYIV